MLLVIGCCGLLRTLWQLEMYGDKQRQADLVVVNLSTLQRFAISKRRGIGLQNFKDRVCPINIVISSVMELLHLNDLLTDYT